jgi:tetratricopeptide (TPR) repeat protein
MNTNVSEENMDQIKHLEEKLAYCEEMIQKNPTLASEYCDKGLLLRALKRYEKGLAVFEQAIQRDPNLVFAYSGKGVLLTDLQRYEEALLAFNQVIERDPTYVRAYKNKGRILTRLQRYNEAIDAYKKAYQLDPADSTVYEVLTKLKRYNKKKLHRGISRLYMELWRVYYAIIIVASGFTMALLSFRINTLFAIGIAILTISAALILLLKTFRTAKR